MIVSTAREQPGDRDSTGFRPEQKMPCPDHTLVFKASYSDLLSGHDLPHGKNSSDPGDTSTWSLVPPSRPASSTSGHRMSFSSVLRLLPGPVKATALRHSSEWTVCFQIIYPLTCCCWEMPDGARGKQSLGVPTELTTCRHEACSWAELSGKKKW